MTVKEIVEACKITDFTILGKKFIIKKMGNKVDPSLLEDLPYSIVTECPLKVLPKNLIKAKKIVASIKGSNVVSDLDCNYLKLRGSIGVDLEVSNISTDYFVLDKVDLHDSTLVVSKEVNLSGSNVLNCNIDTESFVSFAYEKDLKIKNTKIKTNIFAYGDRIQLQDVEIKAGRVSLVGSDNFRGDILIRDAKTVLAFCTTNLDITLKGVHSMYIGTLDYLWSGKPRLLEISGDVDTVYFEENLKGNSVVNDLIKGLHYRNVSFISKEELCKSALFNFNIYR